MRKLVIPAAAALMAMSVSFAWAADVTGVIKSINANAHEIVLDDGKTYSLPQSIKMTDFKEGDKIMVSAEVQNGKNVVSKVEKTG
jgi:Cu/Ag efflux protein CusF